MIEALVGKYASERSAALPQPRSIEDRRSHALLPHDRARVPAGPGRFFDRKGRWTQAECPQRECNAQALGHFARLEPAMMPPAQVTGGGDADNEQDQKQFDQYER